MFRAIVERMPGSNPDQMPHSGLWRVVIYEGERFVRSDREYITYSMAQRLAEELNFQLALKPKAKGAGQV